MTTSANFTSQKINFLAHKQPGIEAKLVQKLSNRLEDQQQEYTSEEIKDISVLDMSLFPEDFELSQESSERFRTLARLSHLELKPARNISSHRKALGPLIVAVKRLSWPFIKAHLQDSFLGIQEFASQMLEISAKQEVKIAELENQLLKRRQ